MSQSSPTFNCGPPSEKLVIFQMDRLIDWKLHETSLKHHISLGAA